MTATVPFLQEKFGEFNKQMFGGQLPMIPIVLSRSRSSLGQFSYRKKRRFFRSFETYDLKIRISICMDLPQNELEDILIHEMIHYYIHYKNIMDTSTHGQVFRQMMNDINTRFHRHLNISHHSTPEQKDAMADKTIKPHVVAVVKFNNGKYGIKVLPRVLQSIHKYTAGVKRSPEFKGINLFVSFNPYFNKFPSSSALRIHYLDKATIDENLKEATPLSI